MTLMKSPADAESETVVLQVFKTVLSRYRQATAALNAEGFDETTPQMVMHVCLGSADTDDLILGIMREDLKVVSIEEQTRRLVERDIGYVTLERGTPNLPDPAAVKADNDLRAFISGNPGTWSTVTERSSDDLARLVMLYLMRDQQSRARGAEVIARLRKSLSPAKRQRLSVKVKRDPNTQKLPGPKFSI